LHRFPPLQCNCATSKLFHATAHTTVMQLTPLKALALQALQCNQPCNQPATSELHNPSKEPPQDTPICNPPEASEKLGGMEPKQRFRGWWWDELDTGADDAEFDEGSPEAAQDLLPILRVLKASLPFKSVLAILSSFRGWWWVPLRSRKKTLMPALSLNGDFEKH